MADLHELLKAAYAEGSKRALMDAGYDAKTAENMSEDLTKEMTPTVPNQFNPVIGLGEKPTKKVSEQTKEAISPPFARRALESGLVSRALNPRTVREAEKGVRSVSKAKRTIERASRTQGGGESARNRFKEHLRKSTSGAEAKETARTIRKQPEVFGVSKEKFLEEAKKYIKEPHKYEGPLKKKVKVGVKKPKKGQKAKVPIKKVKVRRG